MAELLVHTKLKDISPSDLPRRNAWMSAFGRIMEGMWADDSSVPDPLNCLERGEIPTINLTALGIKLTRIAEGRIVLPGNEQSTDLITTFNGNHRLAALWLLYRERCPEIDVVAQMDVPSLSSTKSLEGYVQQIRQMGVRSLEDYLGMITRNEFEDNGDSSLNTIK